MNAKKLCLNAMQAWVESLIGKCRVIGVQAKGERFVFAPLTRARDLRLDYDVTLIPPKACFLPPQETLLTFTGPAGYRSVVDDEPFILLGVHPYDVAAIAQMDRLFEQDYADVHYLARRRGAVLIACDIQTASPNVFAGCMGTATADEGFDILLTRVGDHYLVDARTDAGKALTDSLASAPDADAVSLARREQLWLDNRKLLRKHDLKPSLAELPGLLERSYEHPVWKDKARHCFSCGSCVMVCPTCYCFDVQDEVDWDLKCGRRCRTWDGCMLKDFATVAGAHNFRKDKADRYRHRWYRKGKYVYDKIGQIACVGCGRCVTACVAGISNPVDVYNRLLEAP
ncbi:MAG: 4Fe-4S dicluster domain-containing protein [Lentisphaerae bacterium]|nr:4Fe-4S dicluster domain-containing protein [Lentisphaerota bacterium]